MPGIIGLISPKAENKIFHQMINKINHFDLKSQMESIVLDRKTLSRGFFNKKGIQNLLYEHYHTEKNHARLIWQIINLEYFFRNFID